MSFLNAEWKKLAIANFAVEPEILSEFVPAATGLDLFHGKCYIIMFLNELQPDSVMLAEGSEITVEHKRTIRVNP